MAKPATRSPKILVIAVITLSPSRLNILDEYMKKKYTMTSTRSTETIVRIFVNKSPFMRIITRDMAPGPARSGVANGTILTQNTSWKNVEKALKKMKENHVYTLNEIATTDQERLKELIKSSGFYNQKSRSLQTWRYSL